MPTGQQYATNVPQVQLSAPINNIVTSFNVSSQTSWPTPPYTAIIDIGTSSQEAVDVTAVVGTSLTVVRAVDGTLAFGHASGATFTHADIGRDFREARSHIDATGPTDVTGHSVHGLTTGAVVGTTDTQTLTNKSLTSPTLTSPSIISGGSPLLLPSGPDTVVARTSTDTLTNKTLTSPTINTPTISNPTTTGGTVTNGTISGGNVNGVTFGGTSAGQISPLTTLGAHVVDVLGNTGATNTFNLMGAVTAAGPPTAGTFSVRDIVEDPFTNTLWICTGAGTPGTWAPLKGRILMGTSTPSGNFTFNIPTWAQSTAFSKFVVEFECRSTAAVTLDSLNMQINGTGAAGTYSYAYNTTSSTTGSTVVSSSTGNTVCPITNISTANSSANARTGGRIELFLPNSSGQNRNMTWQASVDFNTTDCQWVSGSGTARITSAISQLGFLMFTGPGFSNTVFNFYAEV